jgi:hypothetical protein
MDLSRRDFLKVLGISAAAVAVAGPRWLDNYPHFRPDRMYGDYVVCSDFPDRILVEVVKERFTPQIREVIPPEYRRNIRWCVDYPGNTIDPLMQVCTVGWKYVPEKKG